MRKRIVKITVGLALVTLLALGGRQVYVTTYADTKMPSDTETSEKETSNTEDQLMATEDAPTVVVDNDGIKSGKENFDAFMKDCNNKKVGSLRIKYEYDFDLLYEDAEDVDASMKETIPDAYVEFDGEAYTYLHDGSKEEYKYLLQLTGRGKNTARTITNVILADEKYTYEQVWKSKYSSNSNDHIPYESLFFY